jgi:hypothetical protein
MKRLIVPPFPAASRRSKRTTSLAPVSRSQACAFSSSICSSRLVSSYSRRVIRSSYGYPSRHVSMGTPSGPMRTGSSISSQVLSADTPWATSSSGERSCRASMTSASSTTEAMSRIGFFIALLQRWTAR